MLDCEYSSKVSFGEDKTMTSKFSLITLRISLVLLLVSVLSGCFVHGGTLNFHGPSNATFSDFANARYVCYSNLVQQSSSGGISAFGGSYSSGPTVSCGAFNACLASMGYYKNANGRFDAAPIKITCKR